MDKTLDQGGYLTEVERWDTYCRSSRFIYIYKVCLCLYLCVYIQMCACVLIRPSHTQLGRPQ